MYIQKQIFPTDKSVWNETAVLVGSDVVWGDEFGWSVTITTNNNNNNYHDNIAVVGVRNYWHQPGSVYIFRYDNFTSTWDEISKLVPNVTDLSSEDIQYYDFGSTVAVDGNLIAVGTDGPGIAYVYKYSSLSDDWELVMKLTGHGLNVGIHVPVAVWGDFVFLLETEKQQQCLCINTTITKTRTVMKIIARVHWQHK